MHILGMKVDWRCVLIKDGALSMEMDGHILTLKLPADNLDTLLQVVQVNSDEKGSGCIAVADLEI